MWYWSLQRSYRWNWGSPSPLLSMDCSSVVEQMRQLPPETVLWSGSHWWNSHYNSGSLRFCVSSLIQKKVMVASGFSVNWINMSLKGCDRYSLFMVLNSYFKRISTMTVAKVGKLDLQLIFTRIFICHTTKWVSKIKYVFNKSIT